MPQKVYGFQLISESDFDNKEIRDVIVGDIKKFYSLDLSFKAWLEKSNNLTKLDIEKLYNSAVTSLKNAFKHKADNKTLKSTLITLEKILKIKYKELEKADKKILNFKKFRQLVKACIDAIDLANSEDALNINNSFLKKYKIFLDVRSTHYSLISQCNFSKESKALIKEMTQAFSNSEKKSKYYLKFEPAFFRKLLSFFGKKSNESPRISKSGKFDLTEDNDLSSWMSNFNNNIKLANLAMISSHDAGSYSMAPISSTDIFGKAAQTQTLNFMGQLKSGAREFDFRIQLENHIPVFYHGPVTGAPVSEAIRQILKFIKTNPKEVIMLRIKAQRDCLNVFYKLPVVRELQKFVYYDGNNKSLSIEKTPGEITLGDVRNAGKNILILKSEDVIRKFNKSERTSHNVDQIIKKELEDLLNHQAKLSKEKSKKLQKISPIDTASIKDFFRSGEKWKPLANSIKNSGKFFQKLLDDDTFKECANLVGIDNTGSKEAIEFAKSLIEINKKRSL